ncbi:hypothetical protein AB9F26_05995 [Falsihalocynthiibacter sp. BN13B15]|uniref:hypothetical protein n=1 Tax=Falsihalocynthiibacter sp. BN13B15 TaxID=3240871 RepID=UPI0035106D5C
MLIALKKLRSHAENRGLIFAAAFGMGVIAAPILATADELWDVKIELPELKKPAGYLDDQSARSTYELSKEEQKKLSESVRNGLSNMLSSIDRWSSSAGFPPPTNREAVILTGCADSPFTYAYAARGGGMKSDELYVLLSNIRRTFGNIRHPNLDRFVAHEFMHMIQYGKWRPLADDVNFNWVYESTSEAFSAFYFSDFGATAKTDGAALGRKSDYDQPLHFAGQQKLEVIADALSDTSKFLEHGSPDQFYSGSNDKCSYTEDVSGILDTLNAIASEADYRRGHFFFNLGRDLNPANPEEYLAKTSHQEPNPAHSGLIWLDKTIQSHATDVKWEGLFDYFPEFIARHADDIEEHFSPQANKGEFEFSPTDEAGTSDYDGESDSIAADPREVVISFGKGTWPKSPKQENQVFLFVQEFEKNNTGEDPLSMVVDSQVVEKTSKYKRAVWANPSAAQLKLFNRVANVSRKPEESRAKNYTLKQSLQRVRWAPDICYLKSAPFTLSLDPKLSDVTQADIAKQIEKGYAEWQVAGDGQVISQEKSQFVIAGDADINFVLKYGGDNPTEHVITVATVTTQGDDCQIKTKDAASGGTAIYTGKGDYSELHGPQGEKIYVGVGRLAANIPQDGGWIKLPPGADGMMRAMFAQLGSSIKPPPWAPKVGSEYAARMPWLFQEWWNFRVITNLMEDDPAMAAIVSYGCPAAAEDCRDLLVEIDGKTTLHRFDKFNRLVSIGAAPPTVTFEHGIFNIGRPPGWGDRPNLPLPPPPRPKPRPGTDVGTGGGESDPSGAPKPAKAPQKASSRCDCLCGKLMSGNIAPVCFTKCSPKLAQCITKQ